MSRIDPPAKRRDDNEARAQFSPDAQPLGSTPPAAARRRPLASLTADQAAEQLNVFLVESGAALRINDAGREHGQIRAFNNRTFDVAKAVPTVVMRNEDYGRIARLMASGRVVEVEATIVNRTFPEGRTQHNVIAEIPGGDKAQEVVMLGGHLDSWHAATGATDNAIGSATMLEAIRILQAIGVQPRRTIRLALWSGEEQGLRGSVAYVAQHFGTFEAPKPEYEHFAGYFNIDSGTGKARGMTVFGPPSAADVLRPLLVPFAGNGVMGAVNTRSRFRGGSDHTSFNEIGLPGISVGPGSDRVRHAHVAHQSRHLRADHRERRAAVGDGDRDGGVSPGDARREAAALHQGRDAAQARCGGGDLPSRRRHGSNAHWREILGAIGARH